MKTIRAGSLHFQQINQQVRQEQSNVTILECMGQRYIGAGQKNKTINIHGTPGNALGAYLDGAEIIVYGNAQDAVGDTMNDGKIIIHGSAGDALGYAMRGGKIFVRGNSGYRTGIHMKEYKTKKPTIVVGGKTGSFLGEYLAGGLIIVLGLNTDACPVGNFTGTGMHGGEIYIRTENPPERLPKQVILSKADDEDLLKIKDILQEYSNLFGVSMDAILSKSFYKLTPNGKNPYKQLYTEN